MRTDVFCSVGLSLGVEVLEPRATLLNFVKDFQTVFQAHDAPECVGFYLSHTLANTGFCFVFLILFLISYFVSVFIRFPRCITVLGSFMYLLVMCAFFFFSLFHHSK